MPAAKPAGNARSLSLTTFDLPALTLSFFVTFAIGASAGSSVVSAEANSSKVAGPAAGVFPSLNKVRTRRPVAFRPAIVNWRTREADVELLAEVVQELGARLLARTK